MSLEGREITIVGAGVAGLALSRALALRGAAVRLAEQAPRIAEVGAGLQVSPNGLCVIDALGLGAELRALSLRANAIRLRDYRGGDVLGLDLARHVRRREYLLVHRARLIDVLEKGAREAGVAIETGTRIDPPGPEGLLIGADGVKSWVRAEINGSSDPFFTGQVAWRALVRDDDSRPVVQVFMGPGRHLVSYPLPAGLRNIVAVEERREWTAEGWNQRDDPENLRVAFFGFAGEVRQWLSRIEDVHVWGLFRHPVADHWHSGRRAILGDAAHPTLPFLAQGANMALEDAWVLADCLHRMPEAEALAAYQERRRDRVARVIAVANANARNYHLASPFVRHAAHLLLRLGGALFPAAAVRRFDWLYGHDVTAP